MSGAYYNEIDPYAAAWLRNLIAAGHVAPGDIDTRNIVDVRPDDLRGYTQCHFFAGIGGWSHALRLAHWSDDRPIWTGSCPCQPFSVAGKGAGGADDRHLWPHWFRLIRECRPATIFGEQVEAAIKHGWLDLVQADLEGIGYAVGAAVLPAAGVGAPHIRSRLWFVAESDSGQRDGRTKPTCGNQRDGQNTGRQESHSCAAGSGCAGDLGDADNARSQGREQRRNGADQRTVGTASMDGFWSNADWIACRDGKARPIEPGTFPLAHGIPGRVGRLRAYGNAIVPQVAAEVIRAYLQFRDTEQGK